MSDLLTADDRRRVLSEARRAVDDALAGGRSATLPAEGVFGLRAGVFVSLHHRGALRGCIGQLSGERPLAETVGRCAIAAATEDPRFPPVSAAEFAECDLEVSVLGPLTPVLRPDEIVVGRHGLIVEQHGRRGLLLPQVATEYGWDRETFLGHTCMKAGLPRDAWKTGARLFRFDAEVFGAPPAGTRHS